MIMIIEGPHHISTKSVLKRLNTTQSILNWT
jgi:hypothetical protein